MFFVHTTLEKFENATINGYFGFVFEGKLGQRKKSHANETSSFFERLRFQNLFCPKLKPAFLECTVGLTEEIKQRFQIPYGCA